MVFGASQLYEDLVDEQPESDDGGDSDGEGFGDDDGEAALHLPPGAGGDWRALGAKAPGVRRDQEFLRRRSVAYAVWDFKLDTPQPKGADLFAGRYEDYCWQLELKPNTGVARAIRQGSISANCETVVAAHFGLTDAGVVPLCRLLKYSPALSVLDMSDNCISDRGMLTVLFVFGRGQCNLRALNLSGNPQISGASVKPLHAFARQKPNLEELGLDGTGVPIEDQQVLHFQVLRNQQGLAPVAMCRGLSMRTHTVGERPRSFKESSTQRRVKQLAERFGMLEEGEGPPQMPLPTPTHCALEGDEVEVEDSWDLSGQFHLASALHRRFIAVNSSVSEMLHEAERHLAAQQLYERQQDLYEAWLRFMLLLRQVRMGLSPEQELILILRRELPVRRIEVESEMNRIIWLLERYEGEGVSQSLLRVRAQQRIDALRAQLERSKRNLRLLRGGVHSALLIVSREEWMRRMNAALARDITDMRREQLQELAEEVSALLEQGRSMAQRGKLADGALIAAGQLRLEELLQLIASRELLMGKASQVFAKIQRSNRLISLFENEVSEKASVVTNGLTQLLADCANWEDTLTFSEILGAAAKLQKFIDAAHIRFSRIVDPALVAVGEQILAELGAYIAKVEARQQAILSLECAVNEKLQDICVGEGSDECKAKLRSMLFSLSEEEEEFEGEVRAHPKRPELQAQKRALAHIRFLLEGGLDVLDKGPSHYGLTRRDLKFRTRIFDIIPVQQCLSKLSTPSALVQEPMQHGSPGISREKVIATLRVVQERLNHFGYREHDYKGTPLVEDENAEMTLELLSNRMQKLGFIDQELVAKIFGLLEPFTFANFRRLLKSPLVSGMMPGHDHDAEADAEEN